jgi:hypothetical protein
MIQDFSTVFVSKQAVRVRAVPIRGNAVAKKIIGMVLAGALLAGVLASLTFCLLIRSGLNELAAQNTIKFEMMKENQGLYTQRKVLLDQKALAQTAGKLGLYTPDSHQIRHI